MKQPQGHLAQLAKLIRYYSLVSTTKAGSGHPSSSLSAADLMTVLMFGGIFRYDMKRPDYLANDRLIFSKGHASPLFYSLWAAAGKLTEQKLLTLRRFDSVLEGHPSMRFPFTEVATGSLGQGLSIGVGMALAAKYIHKSPSKTYVLLGDSEMAEGSVWEAMQSAAFYKLSNLIAVLDVNGLGQRGPTMYGHDIEAYKQRFAAFGWDTIITDGHSLEDIEVAFREAVIGDGKPTVIIAQTIKGKGVSFIENKEGWHGRALSPDELKSALRELGSVDKNVRGTIAMPLKWKQPKQKAVRPAKNIVYTKGMMVATRRAYGDALVGLRPRIKNMVVMDGEVSNSTYADIFKVKYPDRFFEMYIAEQNMVGAALGLSRRGLKPFVSTFSAFFTRAADFIRMAQYSKANIVFTGSHAGVAIGEDGPSQMGLEDIALFRSVNESVVLYPSDAVATSKLVLAAARHDGITYIRTTRGATPVIYPASTSFPIGGSKVLRRSPNDVATVVAAGVTLHEALAAYEILKKKNIFIRVIDAYSIKPLDVKTLKVAARETKHIITVEDHYNAGGLGEAVAAALSATGAKISILAVRKLPRSGKPAELLAYEGIDAKGIVQKVQSLI